MSYTPRIKWTKEMVHQEALKYKSRIDFQKNSVLAEGAARRNGWLDDVCSHMKRLRTNGRTKEECRQYALKYKTMKEFREGDEHIYTYVSRRKWLHEITSHMKKNIKWDNRKDEVHQIALKYQNRGEFCLRDEKYYEVARRRGWLDDICGHMVSVGHKFKRLVYVYEFEDKTVYIGLTGNDIKRSHSHSTSNDSPVYRYQQQTGLNPVKTIITDGYIDSEVAKEIEHNTIQKYKKMGWNVLNRAKAGGLGGRDRIWTDEKIRETISKYTYESELRKNEPKLIYKLQSIGKFNEYAGVLIKDTPIFWSEELIKEKVSNYIYLNDFSNDYPGAINWVRKNNKGYLIEGLLKLRIDKKFGVKKYYNKEEILIEASKFKTISEFRKVNYQMHKFAVEQGWLGEIEKIIPPIFRWTKDKVMEITQKYTDYVTFRKENKPAYDTIKKYGWEECLSHLKRTFNKFSYDLVKEEALKYKCRNDFCNGSNNAYAYALRHGILDEITTHMEKRNVKGYKKEVFTCSVCGEKVGAINNLRRWHEDNCKPNRPNSNKNKRSKSHIQKEIIE